MVKEEYPNNINLTGEPSLSKAQYLSERVQGYISTIQRLRDERDELAKKVEEQQKIIDELVPYEILQKIRSGDCTYISTSIIEFNHWLAMLPDDDFARDFENATPVHWDVELGEWIEGEE